MTTLVLPGKQPVELSEAAIAHFDTVAAQKVVNFGVEGGGCTGFQYSWTITDEVQPDYDITKYDHFTFAVDNISLMYLIGTTVDYETDFTGSRIVVNNPQAVSSCGCGESIGF